MVPRFVFFTCQVGAEQALRRELARHHADWRIAFSRPGFLTFKLPDDPTPAVELDAGLVFARSQGFSLGKILASKSDDPADTHENGAEQTFLDMARQAWELAGDRPYQRLHVWRRARRSDARDDAEVGSESYVAAVEQALRRRALEEGRVLQAKTLARPGELVLDCVLNGPGEWWLGYHVARGQASRWPGGMLSLTLPADAVSRGWLKMEEALRWSRLPLHAGDRCVEIGAAPGGASQALLARGVELAGVDPANIHPTVLAHPNFVHIRKRGADVRRRDFQNVHWLTADMNVAPNYTLDTLEAIARHPAVSLRGLLLTLKLPDWKLADEVPGYLARIRAWGFPYVRAVQLQYNRQEICVCALRRKPNPAREWKRDPARSRAAKSQRSPKLLP